jgi:hypothetical protein
MFGSILSIIFFLLIVVIGALLLKSLIKTIIFVISAVLIFVIVAGAIVFIDIQTFNSNFYNSPNQVLLRDSEEIISGFVLDFTGYENDTIKPTLLPEEMIRRADGFYKKNALDAQKPYYRNLIFDISFFANTTKVGDFSFEKNELIRIITADQPVITLKEILYEKNNQEEADLVLIKILSDVSNEDNLKSYLFAVMFEKSDNDLSLKNLLSLTKEKSVTLVPETPIFTIARFFPNAVNLVVKRFDKK